jgi:ribonuclease-3
VPDLVEFQKRVGYEFRDPALLELALTHPSIAHEGGGDLAHNQRLEFLGDAVLGLVLTQELYVKFPRFEEGPLTKARAQMVNRKTLAEQGRQISLGENLILSRGEEASGGRERVSALADGFEALIGAIFLDRGFDAVREFVLRSFRDAFGELNEIPNLENPKGELQELLQARSPEAPSYEMASSSGPDHDRIFEAVVFHAGQELGRGKGKSKKEAESEAADAALKLLREAAGPAGDAKTSAP